MSDGRNALRRDRGSDVDQRISDIGKGEAKVADLARLVRHRLGFVICPSSWANAKAAARKAA